MHARARPCTLVGEPGWVPAALPSIHRVMYRGGSQESINHLRTPAVGAGKVGYSWETGIPACPPPRRGTQDVTPQCRTPPSPIGTTLGWRDPGIARDPQTGTGLGMVVPTSMLAVRPCQRHAKDGAAFLLLQFGGLLPSGTVSAPPQPHVLAWRRGEGAEGLEGVS